jgi:hypothetical protein
VCGFGLNSSASGYESVSGFCEHGTEHSNFTNDEEFLD